MEGYSRRNAGEEEIPRRGGSTIHIMKDDLQRMIEEASRKTIMEYERRTATPVVKETARRQLFETTEPHRVSREPSEPEHRIEPGFRVPDLQRYGGTKDPQEHVGTFEMVMNLYGQPGPIMAKLFATTLLGKAQEWFTNLPRGSIESYEQLVQKFNFHFASKKKQKRSATPIQHPSEGE
ncbi:UNVERIFIED_CONTAM: hypothetical protein Sindi_0064700 [Sesamum indicum]